MPYKAFLILIAGLLFCISGAGCLAVRLFLKPKDSDLDDIYWEFEDSHPKLKRYTAWSRVFFTGIVISMLLLFVAIAI